MKMPLVNAKCTNCGANLNVDNTKDAAICQYCGSAFIVEKAINNYNITNNNNINANVVNIYGGNSSDFQIRAGTLEKYTGASTVVVIPNSVTEIGDSAFKDCSALTSVTIPNSVTKIGNSAFKNCSALTSVTIPNSVTEIGGSAFRGCRSLTNLNIPNSVTKIGGSAFRDCSSLKSVTIPNSVTKICWYAFQDCSSLTDVKILGKPIYHGAFDGTPYESRRKEEIRREEIRREEIRREEIRREEISRRKSNGLCQHCGGSFKGIFNKVCSKCGKPKDY